MKKKYNAFSGEWITIDEESKEHVCQQCKGRGKSERYPLRCKKCRGKGKFDWLDNVISPQTKALLIFCLSFYF
jgi:DnaJ-class molecular chaperone